jgi:hypothetical protein
MTGWIDVSYRFQSTEDRGHGTHESPGCVGGWRNTGGALHQSMRGSWGQPSIHEDLVGLHILPMTGWIDGELWVSKH